MDVFQKLTMRLLALFTAIATFIGTLFSGGGSVDFSAVTQADYDRIKSAYIGMMLGAPDADIGDPVIAAKVNAIVNAGATASAQLVKDGRVPWDGGESITVSSQITGVYNRVYAMALAYACPQGALYKDEQLLEDILYALDWMYDSIYGAQVSERTKFGNWWDWEIGGPTKLVETLLLIEDGIDAAAVAKYLRPVNYFVAEPKRTSANLVDSANIVIGAAALEGNAPRLWRAREKLDEVFVYVKASDGFYTDGSYVMHINIAYQGGYGTIMLEALSRTILALEGTFFEIAAANKAVQAAWAFDSFLPLMYKGGLPGMVRGRNIVRNVDDIGIGYPAVAGMLRMTQYTAADSAARLAEAVKYFYLENTARYNAAASLYDYGLFKALAADESVRPLDANVSVKVFPRMDRVAKLTETYAVGIAMSSKRIAKYEAINNENGKGWYTGDGMLYVDLSGADYNQAFWHNVNYYRLPGTTVTTRERNDKNLPTTFAPNTRFAGGVAFEENAVAAMQLLGSNPDFGSTLKARKAWFLFDEEIVALGADIDCKDKFNTETVIENRVLKPGAEFLADGQSVTTPAGTLHNPGSVYIGGLGGIVFPANATVQFRRTPGAPEFVELWQNHGQEIQNATYAYTVLPGQTPAQTLAYAQHPQTMILANTPAVQAVRDITTGVTGYVFWSHGCLENITVGAACTLLTKQTDTGLTVTVSDPTQRLLWLTVFVRGEFAGVTADDNVRASVGHGGVTLRIDMTDRDGLGSTAVLTAK